MVLYRTADEMQVILITPSRVRLERTVDSALKKVAKGMNFTERRSVECDVFTFSKSLCFLLTAKEVVGSHVV